MLPIYDQIADEELKVSKGTPALLPTSHVVNKRLAGIKMGLSISFAMIAATIVGLGYMYYVVQGEVRERQVLQASHIALSERTAAMQTALEDYKLDAARMSENLKMSMSKQTLVQNEIRKEIEKRRIEILNMQKRFKVYENNDSVSSPVSFPEAHVETIAQTMPTTVAPQTAPAAMKVATIPAQEFTPLIPQAPSVTQTTVIPQSALINTAAPTQEPMTRYEDKTQIASPVSTPSDDRILTVNRQFQFVVINVGSEDKVKEGDRFEVVRNGKVIASLQVEKLYDGFSAATIMKEDNGLPVEVGDGIRRVS